MKRMALAVISLVVGVAGCTGGPGPAPGSTSPPLSSPSDASASTSAAEGSNADPFAIQRNTTDLFGPLPLDAYMLNTAERYQLNLAVQALTNRCMADFGFPPEEASESLEELIIVDRESKNRRYGIADVEQAKVSGLLPAHVVWSLSREGEKKGDPARLLVELGTTDGQPMEDQTASPGEVDGKAIPPNGCLGDAREIIFGTNTTYAHFTLADDLENATAEEAAADSRVVAVENEWVSCMAGRGYRYLGMRDDTEREKSYSGLKEQERPTTAEIQLAVAEAECSNQVGYPTAAYQVELELQHKIIEENQLALTEERKAIDEALVKDNEFLKEN